MSFVAENTAPERFVARSSKQPTLSHAVIAPHRAAPPHAAIETARSTTPASRHVMEVIGLVSSSRELHPVSHLTAAAGFR